MLAGKCVLLQIVYEIFASCTSIVAPSRTCESDELGICKCWSTLACTPVVRFGGGTMLNIGVPWSV